MRFRMSLTLTAALAGLMTSPVMASDIPWMSDVNGAIRLAQQTNRMVLVHFYTDACPPCRKLEKVVYSQPGIGQEIAKDFVPVKVNAEKSPKIAKAYGIDRWPQDVLLDSSGKKLTAQRCPIDRSKYMGQLAQAVRYLKPIQAAAPTQVASRPGMPGAGPNPSRVGPVSANPYVATPGGRPTMAASTGQPVAYAPPAPPAAGQYRPPAATLPAGPTQPAPAVVKPYSPPGPNQSFATTASKPYSPPTVVKPYTPPATNRPAANPPVAGYRPPQTAARPAAKNPGIAMASQPGATPRSSYQPSEYSTPASTGPASTSPYAPPVTVRPPVTNDPRAAAAPSAYGVAASMPNPNVPPAYQPPGLQRNPAANVQPPAPAQPTQPQTVRPPAAPSYTAQPPTSPAAAPGPAATVNNPYAPRNAQPAPPRQPSPFALDGKCPVALAEQGVWVAGDTTHGAVHRGKTYIFSGKEQQTKFLANPDFYSPAISGLDPVLAFDHGQRVPGSRRHGVTLGEGRNRRVYLFSSEETLAKFTENKRRYQDAVRTAEAGLPPTRR